MNREGLMNVPTDVQPTGYDDVDLDLAARSTVNVLVTATNSADRAVWARAIHDRSTCSAGPFVAVNGPALSGDVDGGGADTLEGQFERAAGGTLFIDRIGELSPSTQRQLSSLLRAQSPPPTHGKTPADPDRRVRVVSGSHRSLQPDVAVGTFSDRLFYQLNVIHLDRTQGSSVEHATAADRQLARGGG
jgi:two-component system response regulator HydG